MASAAQKTSWADDVDEFEAPKPSKVVETVDENGIVTIVEYTTNEEGRKIKVTRRIRRTVQKAIVEHSVAERRGWSKFGKEKGNKPGIDLSTTTTERENIVLKLSPGNKSSNEQEAKEPSADTPKKGMSSVKCRYCQGDHYTARCPHKDALAGLDALTANGAPLSDELGSKPDAGGGMGGAAGGSTIGGKYVPPSMRGGPGSRGPGETMRGPGGGIRDDYPTLRVTNVFEDATEDDLTALFSKFGTIKRVYVGRDRETGQGKGFAFVSFLEKQAAQTAMEKMHRYGYANLLLNVQWSQAREERK